MHITASLLHRLIDNEPHQVQEQGEGYIIDYACLQQEIRKNLENVLNTRLNLFNFPHQYPLIKTSILNYGMPNFSRQYYVTVQKQRELCENIKSVIEAYEPRLQNVKVHVMSIEAKEYCSLVIRIQGLIPMRLDSKQAVFESNLDISSYQFSVGGEPCE